MPFWSKRLWAILGLAAAVVSSGRAQTLKWVQIQVPDIREPKTDDAKDSGRYVRNLSALSAAVLEVNRAALDDPLDFVALSGDCEAFAQDPASAADIAAPLFAALDVETIVLTQGSGYSCEAGTGRAVFVRELVAKLPNKTVLDVYGQTSELRQFSLSGVNSEAFASKLPSRRSAELDRLAGVLAKGNQAVIFASTSEANPELSSGAIWPLTGEDQTRWTAFLQNPKFLGIFVTVPGASPTVAAPTRGTEQAGDRRVVYLLPSLDETYDRAQKAGAGIMLISLNAEGRVETRPISLSNRFSEEAHDLESVLIQAGLAEGDKDYETADHLYGDALKSKDPGIRNSAEAGLRRVNDRLQGRWERWESKSSILGWIGKHWADLYIALGLAMVVGVWLLCRYLLPAPLRIGVPVKMNDDAPGELFLVSLFREMDEIRDTWYGGGGSPRTRDGLQLYLPPESSQGVMEELPKLIGETSASAVKVVFFFWRYFSWRVESSVYGCEENAAVHIRICWGWRTKACWTLPPVGKGPTGIRDCATEIAYNLSAESLVI